MRVRASAAATSAAKSWRFVERAARRPRLAITQDRKAPLALARAASWLSVRNAARRTQPRALVCRTPLASRGPLGGLHPTRRRACRGPLEASAVRKYERTQAVRGAALPERPPVSHPCQQTSWCSTVARWRPACGACSALRASSLLQSLLQRRARRLRRLPPARLTPGQTWCAPAPRTRQQDATLCGVRHAPRCLLTTSAGPAQDADARAAAHTLVAIKAAQPQPGPADLGAAAGGTSGPAKRKRGGTEVRRCSPMHASLSAAGAGHARGAAGRGRQCSRACAGGRPVLCGARARCDSRSVRGGAAGEGVQPCARSRQRPPLLTSCARRGAERDATRRARQAGRQAPARMPPGAARAGARTHWRRASGHGVCGCRQRA